MGQFGFEITSIIGNIINVLIIILILVSAPVPISYLTWPTAVAMMVYIYVVSN